MPVNQVVDFPYKLVERVVEVLDVLRVPRWLLKGWRLSPGLRLHGWLVRRLAFLHESDWLQRRRWQTRYTFFCKFEKAVDRVESV